MRSHNADGRHKTDATISNPSRATWRYAKDNLSEKTFCSVQEWGGQSMADRRFSVLRVMFNNFGRFLRTSAHFSGASLSRLSSASSPASVEPSSSSLFLGHLLMSPNSSRKSLSSLPASPIRSPPAIPDLCETIGTCWQPERLSMWRTCACGSTAGSPCRRRAVGKTLAPS